MPRFPNVSCVDCGSRKLYYQKELSIVDRKNSENNIPVYWCTDCDQLIQLRRKIVADAVSVVRTTILKNRKKPIYN